MRTWTKRKTCTSSADAPGELLHEHLERAISTRPQQQRPKYPVRGWGCFIVLLLRDFFFSRAHFRRTDLRLAKSRTYLTKTSWATQRNEERRREFLRAPRFFALSSPGPAEVRLVFLRASAVSELITTAPQVILPIAFLDRSSAFGFPSHEQRYPGHVQFHVA